MVHRALGATGLAVSPIGLGTVKLGRNTGVKYPAPFSLPTDAEARQLLEAALEMGVTFYDTAPAYGDSEKKLAPFVAAHRDEIVLCTKVGETYAHGQSTFDFSLAAMRASVEASLRRLGTDHIDLLLLHSHGNEEEILQRTDAVQTIGRLMQEGKTRFTGISAKTANGIFHWNSVLDVVMAPFSREDPALERALRDAHGGGAGVLAIKGLASGKVASPRDAVRFVLDHSFIDCLVVGTLSATHLAEVVHAAEEVRA